MEMSIKMCQFARYFTYSRPNFWTRFLISRQVADLCVEYHISPIAAFDASPCNHSALQEENILQVSSKSVVSVCSENVC